MLSVDFDLNLKLHVQIDFFRKKRSTYNLKFVHKNYLLNFRE